MLFRRTPLHNLPELFSSNLCNTVCCNVMRGHFQRTMNWRMQTVRTQCTDAVLTVRLRLPDQISTDACHAIRFHKVSTVLCRASAAARTVRHLPVVLMVKAVPLSTARWGVIPCSASP